MFNNNNNNSSSSSDSDSDGVQCVRACVLRVWVEAPLAFEEEEEEKNYRKRVCCVSRCLSVGSTNSEANV